MTLFHFQNVIKTTFFRFQRDYNLLKFTKYITFVWYSLFYMTFSLQLSRGTWASFCCSTKNGADLFFFLIRIRNKAKKNTAHLGLPDRTKSPLVWLLGSHLFGWYQVLNIKSKWIDLGENPLKSQFTLLSNAGTWHKNGHFWMCWVTRVYVLSCVLKYRIQVNPFYFLNRLK